MNNPKPTTGAADQIPVKWDPGDWRPDNDPRCKPPPDFDAADWNRRHGPESGAMRTPPHLVKWLQGAATLTDTECARRASQSAWRRWDGEGSAPLDASGKPLKKGDPCELLPAPAGEDEARMRYPQCFVLPAEAPALSAGATDPKVRKAAVRKARKAAKDGPAPPPEIRRSTATWVPPILDGIMPGPLRLCNGEDELTELIREHADGRLARVREDGQWLAFRDGAGWRPVTDGEMLKGAATVGRLNLGSTDSAGEVTLNPRTGGRATTAAGVLRLLAGCVESSAADWDADPAVVGVGGAALELRTGTMRPAVAADRLRRRLASAPADDDAYAASRWQGVIKHVLPDPQEREYLQRRLGLALMCDGPDDLLWLFGDAGSGKGVALAALRAAFGSYAAAIPAAEVTAGGSRGHAQWRARLRGARLMLIDDAPPRDLDTGVINGLLGSIMSANLMRQGGVDFRVDAPLFVTANRLPRIRANDAGFRRRLKAVQAGAAIPEDDRDPELRRAVTMPVEQAAVVRWLCDGARMASGVEVAETEGGGAFRRGGGCPVPASIRARTGEVERDAPVSEFAELFTAGKTITSDDLWRRWCEHQSSRGGLPGGRTTLTNTLRDEYGWTPTKGSKGVRQWVAGGAGGAGGAVSTSGHHDARDHVRREWDEPADVPLAPPAPPDGGERDDDDDGEDVRF